MGRSDHPVVKFRVGPLVKRALHDAAAKAKVQPKKFARQAVIDAISRADELAALRASASDLRQLAVDLWTLLRPHEDSDALASRVELVLGVSADILTLSDAPAVVEPGPAVESMDTRAAVLEAAVGELGKHGTQYNGHGGPQIEHIVRADGDEYHRYWLVLTAEGKRVLSELSGSWAERSAALVAAEERSGERWRIFAPPEDWCAMFVSWALAEVYTPGRWWDWRSPGHALDGHPFEKWFGGVHQTRAWAEGEGVWLDRSDVVEAPLGACFVLKGGTHIGFIREDLGGGRFRSVEGNWGDAVVSIERDLDDCDGVILWWLA